MIVDVMTYHLTTHYIAEAHRHEIEAQIKELEWEKMGVEACNEFLPIVGRFSCCWTWRSKGCKE